MGEPSREKNKFQIDDSLIFRALCNNDIFSFYIKDLKGQILHASIKMVHDLGFAEEAQMVGKTDVELFGPDYGISTLKNDLSVIETGEPIIGLVECYISPQGKENWVSTTKFPIKDPDGNIVGLIGITNEINDLRQAEQELVRMATHDPLTSLPNRALLHNRILNSIESAKLTSTKFAVLFIDLDNFKAVNDRFGHSIGDQILVDIARVFEFSVRSSDTVSRYGGDEFVVLLEGIMDEQNVRDISEKISNNTSEYFRGLHITGGVSIGASLYPQHGQNSEELIKASDEAMYAAKAVRQAFRWAKSSPEKK